jgi:pimeloyl-ACP methyl ester carboxylesterase
LNKPKHKSLAADLRGISQLAIQATLGITDLVEAMHGNILGLPEPGFNRANSRTRGLTGLIYKAIRGTTGAVGHGLDTALGTLSPFLGTSTERVEREHALSALNGIVGDHLHGSSNPLAITMQFRQYGKTLALHEATNMQAIPDVSGRIVILVHGLCMNDLQWSRKDSDGQIYNYGHALKEDFGLTPVFLHYNTGLPISENGRLFDSQIEALVEAWPVAVDDILIIAHSMGGLVTRKAHHHAQRKNRKWRKLVRKVVFLGTPHHGAPLERGGHWVDLVLDSAPMASPFAKIGKIRSIGITDLRHGLSPTDFPDRLPLPADVESLVIAAQTGTGPFELHRELIGDGLVPVDSALGRHKDPDRHLNFADAHRLVFQGLNHLDLLSNQAVYAAIKRFMT